MKDEVKEVISEPLNWIRNLQRITKGKEKSKGTKKWLSVIPLEVLVKNF